MAIGLFFVFWLWVLTLACRNLVLSLRRHSVFQLLAIIEYLDDIQPKPRLIPEDARERAYARSLALMTIADAHPLVVPRVRNHLAKTFGADAKAIEG
jgi:glutathione S-transferase